MFDNQLPQTIRKWKEMVPAHVKVEASGGITFRLLQVSKDAVLISCQWES
ncbi:hypothetical protein [Ligilactobacillus ruminis]